MVIRDVPYRTVDGVTLRMNICPSHGIRPAVLWVHGGGWKDGDRYSDADYAARLADQGFVVFTIDYRLACRAGQGSLCGYHFPALVSDVQAALSWIRAHGATYGADARKVGVVGASAGGNLGGMLGVGPTRADAVVAFSGTMKMSICRGTHCEVKADYIGCSWDTCPQRWAEASPITFVSASAAPFFMSNGEYESVVPPKDSREMAAALRAVGVPNRRFLEAGSSCHALACVDRDPALWNAAVSWLRAYLMPNS